MASVRFLYTALCIMVVLFIIAAINTCRSDSPAEAHHDPDGKLPLVPFTWLIQTTLQDKEVRWCVDNRARDWPNFVSQLIQVNDAATRGVGIPHRQIHVNIASTIDIETAKAQALAAGCMILHRIPDNHGCSGCAAWIYYGDKPAVAEYKWQVIATYTDLKTTHAHEGTNCGHAMGEAEGYIDEGGQIGSHILILGRWAAPWNGPTVMDVGTHLVVKGGVWECTEADVRLICSWLDPNGQLFTGCGKAPEPCGNPCWDGQRWRFDDGWSYRPDAGCGEWYDPQNRLTWAACDDSWNGRWSPVLGAWVQRGHTGSAFIPAYGWLSLVAP